MKTLFPRNIGTPGRLLRGVMALLLFAGAVAGFAVSPWLSLGLGLAGGFTLFEALRGWCALRACGIKTRL